MGDEKFSTSPGSEALLPTGAVLVVGGGIGGIQSSLDLAESGFKVYLVERNLSIGGTMAQLDKTFPTNDCAMCILSPKLVDAGRHRNIQILPLSTVESVEGEAGNFRVTVRKKPRYVDIEKCTRCGDCTKVCPVELPNEYEQGLVQRRAIYPLFAQSMPSAYGIDKGGDPSLPGHLSDRYKCSGVYRPRISGQIQGSPGPG